MVSSKKLGKIADDGIVDDVERKNLPLEFLLSQNQEEDQEI